ncbi:hypothetical protein B484DRAFT_408411, partial [Ochromonadaceae sp. CCMP2298]
MGLGLSASLLLASWFSRRLSHANRLPHTANPFGVGGGMEPEGPSLDWQPPLFSLLVILQLAHVGAMQQTTYLLRRDEDLKNQSVEELEVGNALPQVPGSRCGMEDAWLCDGARGFTCLAFAILRQPE